MNTATQTGDVAALLSEITARSSVKIETNSRGHAQTKISVYAGETEAEMERLVLLASKMYDDLNSRLGDRANFG